LHPGPPPGIVGPHRQGARRPVHGDAVNGREDKPVEVTTTPPEFRVALFISRVTGALDVATSNWRAWLVERIGRGSAGSGRIFRKQKYSSTGSKPVAWGISKLIPLTLLILTILPDPENPRPILTANNPGSGCRCLILADPPRSPCRSRNRDYGTVATCG